MKGIRNPGFFWRSVSIFAILVIFYSSTALGVNLAVTGFWAKIGQALQSRPGPFTDVPRPIFKGDHPGRDPKTRGGVWSETALRNAQEGRFAELFASIGGAVPGGHKIAVAAEPGEAYAWEGKASGGSLNSGNGNKLTSIPLVSWKDRGGMPIDFTLYHNSETSYNDELGKGWTWTYDIYVNDAGSTATVHWGTGLCIPFTLSGSNYIAPAGIFDTLVKNGNGTWTLTKKNGSLYKFNTAAFCNEIDDPNGNAIILTLNGSNYCTRITAPSGRYIDVSLSGTNFASVTDPGGNAWTFTINGTSDTLTSVTWPTLSGNSYTDSFSYDTAGRITTHTDRRGKAWTATYYGGDGSLTTETTPLSHTTSYAYTETSATITLPGSQTIVHNYSSGKLASEVDPASYSESYSYNSNKLVTSRVDRRGKTWTYTYDSSGNMLTLTNPLSKVWTYTYNSLGRVLTETDPLSHITTNTYNSYGNLLTTTDALSHCQATNTYDGYGQLYTSTNALSKVTSYAFDTYGNLTSVTDPLSHVTSMTYTTMGLPATVVDANSNTETLAYDVWGRLTTVTHPDSTYASTAYDAVGHGTSTTNERGKTTTYAYDDTGRLTSVTNAKSEVESYAYNSNGWRTSVTNGRSKTRNYVFNSRGQVYTLTLPDSSVETWSYNGNGQTSAYTNPLSQTINYTFDDASRQTGIDYPTGTDTSFAYDYAGRQTSMVDSTGTTSWTYDNANRVTQLAPPQGTLNYAYNNNNSRCTMQEVNVGTTTYTYDDAGRLTSLANPFSETTSLTYDSGNRVTQKTFSSGQYEATSFDSRNRTTQVLLKNSSNSTLRTQSWTYDNASNVATQVQGGVTTTYGYDDIDQLTSESRSGYSASYTYDANGNRATKVLGGVTDTYTNDDADKLTSISRGGSTIKSYTYDTAGRTTAVSASGSTTNLAYDYEGRVTTITYPNSSTNTFTYNGLDTRVSKVDSGGTKTYLRDGVGVTDPVLNDASANFTPGTSERRSSTTTFYHHGFKDAESQTGTGQTVTAAQSFDAFGNPDTSSGTWKGPFGYGGSVGYQSDSDSGLQLLGHRYYDSATGRFLTRDTVNDGRNWYTYCSGNPTTNADPDGNLFWFIAAAIVVLIVSVGTANAPTHPGDFPSDPWKMKAISKLYLSRSPVAFAASAYAEENGAGVYGGVHGHHPLSADVQDDLRPEQIPEGYDTWIVPIPSDVHTGDGGFHSGTGYPFPGGHWNNAVRDGIDEVAGSIGNATSDQVKTVVDDLMELIGHEGGP